ncbi:MAG: DNA-3-methyladenine glycosylase 2 [Candidatus Micrarchaeia archaeon]
MQYNKLFVSDFSLLHTYSSGQTLNFAGTLEQKKYFLHLSATTPYSAFEINYAASGDASGTLYWRYKGLLGEKEAEEELRQLLGVHTGVRSIYSKLEKDTLLKKAIEEFYGMRVVKADPWQTAVCFIVSQFNNIKRISKIIGMLINKFGKTENGAKLFPSPESIARASKASLLACGLGFRASYLRDFASSIVEGFDLSSLYKLSYEEAKNELMQFKGIGDKVADCILLFGYGKLEAFPVDTWIKRIVEKEYLHRRSSLKQIHEFAARRFGGLAGYAQQYLFQYARESGLYARR